MLVSSNSVFLTAAFYSRQGANKFFFWEIGASQDQKVRTERARERKEINGLGEPRRTYANEKGETRAGHTPGCRIAARIEKSCAG